MDIRELPNLIEVDLGGADWWLSRVLFWTCKDEHIRSFQVKKRWLAFESLVCVHVYFTHVVTTLLPLKNWECRRLLGNYSLWAGLDLWPMVSAEVSIWPELHVHCTSKIRFKMNCTNIYINMQAALELSWIVYLSLI